jgi:hypothetical protein
MHKVLVLHAGSNGSVDYESPTFGLRRACLHREAPHDNPQQAKDLSAQPKAAIIVTALSSFDVATSHIQLGHCWGDGRRKVAMGLIDFHTFATLVVFSLFQ